MNLTVRVRDMKTLDKIVKQIRKMPAILEIATKSKSKNKARQADASGREKKELAPHTA